MYAYILMFTYLNLKLFPCPHSRTNTEWFAAHVRDGICFHMWFAWIPVAQHPVVKCPFLQAHVKRDSRTSLHAAACTRQWSACTDTAHTQWSSIPMDTAMAFAPLRAPKLSQKRLGDENQQEPVEEREGERLSSITQRGSSPPWPCWGCAKQWWKAEEHRNRGDGLHVLGVTFSNV